MELTAVPIERPDDLNVIVGQAHFVKTVEDLHEALAGVSPHLRFGVAFCEASGPCLIRRSGNDEELVALAVRNAEAIGAGHCFVVFLRDGFPVNVLNPLKLVPEVCTVFCATANPVEIIVAETELWEGGGGCGGRPAPGRRGDRRPTRPTARPSSVTSATSFEVPLGDVRRYHQYPGASTERATSPTGGAATRDLRLLSPGRPAGTLTVRARA